MIDIAGGAGLRAECQSTLQSLPGCRLPVGTAVLTRSHDLAVGDIRGIVHVVAPRYSESAGGGVKAQLKQSVTAALTLADTEGHSAIAVCGLGAGVFGWPAAAATALIVMAVREWAARRTSDSAVRVVLYDSATAVVEGFMSVLRSPEAAATGVGKPPRAPTHQWFWNGPEAPPVPGKWVPYDYDQSEQIEAAYAANVKQQDLVTGDMNVSCESAVCTRLMPTTKGLLVGVHAAAAVAAALFLVTVR